MICRELTRCSQLKRQLNRIDFCLIDLHILHFTRLVFICTPKSFFVKQFQYSSFSSLVKLFWEVLGHNIIFSSQAKCRTIIKCLQCCFCRHIHFTICMTQCLIMNQDLHQRGWIIKNISTRINQIDLKNDKSCHFFDLIGMRHARKDKEKKKGCEINKTKKWNNCWFFF